MRSHFCAEFSPGTPKAPHPSGLVWLPSCLLPHHPFGPHFISKCSAKGSTHLQLALSKSGRGPGSGVPTHRQPHWGGQLEIHLCRKAVSRGPHTGGGGTNAFFACVFFCVFRLRQVFFRFFFSFFLLFSRRFLDLCLKIFDNDDDEMKCLILGPLFCPRPKKYYIINFCIF